MRHKDKANKPSSEQPAQKSGFKVDDAQAQEGISPTRLQVKIGPPQMSWSHAKWLALADQALLE